MESAGKITGMNLNTVIKTNTLSLNGQLVFREVQLIFVLCLLEASDTESKHRAGATARMCV